MKKTVMFSAIALSLSGCFSAQPVEQWQKYGSASPNIDNLAPHQALALFYRPNEPHPKAINLYINGDYQASLLTDSFTTIPVCGTKQLFTASFSDKSQFGNRTEGANYTLPVKEIGYIRVTSDANGKAILANVDKATAEREMQGLKPVTTTRSRVPSGADCNPVLAVQNLSANALFAFDKAEYADILAQGRLEITRFAQKIQAMNGSIERIVVSGYTDPQGSADYNQALSQRRAESVAKVLQEMGVSQPIEAVGYGQADLLIPNCATLYAKNSLKQVACNQPNRRVEIAVYGH